LRASGNLAALQPAVELLFKLLDADGFGEIIVHASGEALLAVAIEHMRGDGDDRHPMARAAFDLADRPACLQAVHHGHGNIHQDHARPAGAEKRHRLLTITDNAETQPRRHQHLGEEDLVDLVVLGHQHIQDFALRFSHISRVRAERQNLAFSRGDRARPSATRRTQDLAYRFTQQIGTHGFHQMRLDMLRGEELVVGRQVHRGQHDKRASGRFRSLAQGAHEGG